MGQATARSRSTVSRSLPWARAGAADQLLVRDPRLRIVLVSFSLLFFELLCIRWIPAYIRYLSYFNNFILLASFLGIGLGMLSARRARFWAPPFPLLLLVLVGVVARNRFDLRIASAGALYFGDSQAQAGRSERFIILPLIFALVTLAFIPLARPLGRLFTQVKPLTAYTFDIVGSLAGTASFFAISYFALPPVVWFTLLAVPVVMLSTRWFAPITALALLVSVLVVAHMQRGAYWSPYYKIVLSPLPPDGYQLSVNNVGHQSMLRWQEKEPFYRRVYDLFPGQTFDNVLILGAGSGSDTATALANGATSVTAVEIDPKIADLGARYNPDQPFSDPRVRVAINDGRAYLQNTSEKYDLIIFALPDSLTLTSNMSSLRLESFLLTQDAIATARSRLTDNGLVVLYNYYRQDWLVAKLASMVGDAFGGQPPFVSTYGGWGRAAVIMDGPRLAALPAGALGPYSEDTSNANPNELRVIGEGLYPVSDRRPATDDWPFLYLPGRGFPLIYAEGLAMVLAFTLLGLAVCAPRAALRRFDWHMFFLGVAFALLETKSLIAFALLFGSTWTVNSLVFFAILVSVLLAVLVNQRWRVERVRLLYLALFATLALNFIVRPERLLFQNELLRYAVASVLTFAPVFLANVIFSNAFRDSETADVAFASNLLGIMLGGMLEYFSMVMGYHLLMLPVIAFYGVALLLWRRGGWTPPLPRMA